MIFVVLMETALPAIHISLPGPGPRSSFGGVPPLSFADLEEWTTFREEVADSWTKFAITIKKSDVKKRMRHLNDIIVKLEEEISDPYWAVENEAGVSHKVYQVIADGVCKVAAGCLYPVPENHIGSDSRADCCIRNSRKGTKQKWAHRAVSHRV